MPFYGDFAYTSLMIPLLKPRLASLEMVNPYLIAMYKSGYYSNYGPLAKLLESRYANFLKVEPENVVCIANATLAIEACLEVSEIKDWFVPDYTFAATAQAVLRAKKNLHLLDVCLDSLMVDISLLPDQSNLGLIPVLPFGRHLDLFEFHQIENLVIDAAASLGSEISNLSRLKTNQFVVFSLHATKVLGAGEGGLIVCGNSDQAEKIRAWANFGFKKGTRSSEFPATNAKMSEITASFALAALDNVAVESREWKAALNYKKEFLVRNGFNNVTDEYEGFRPYWIFDIGDSHTQDDFIKFLNGHGVEARSWWAAPISQMNAFGDRVHSSTLKGNSRKLSARLVGLPMWRQIPETNLDQVFHSISKFMKR